MPEQSSSNSRLKRNIPLLYWFKFIQWFMLTIPILVLFYEHHGLSMQEVFITQAVFSAIIVILEIPSGYFADVVGRKASMIVAAFAGATGTILYAFSSTLWGFLAAECFLGIAAAFISGADTALVYDTVQELGKQNEYHKIQGRMDSVDNFSEGSASVLGGLLALISLEFPFYIRAAIMVLTIPLAFFLVEPPHHRLKETKHLRQIFTTVRHTFHDHKELKWFVIYTAFLGAAGFNAVWFIQPYWEKIGISVGFFGILWAILQWITGFSAIFSHRLEQKFGKYKLFIAFGIVTPLAYLVMGLLPIGFIGVFCIPLFYFIRGIRGPIEKNTINSLIEPHHRATVLSLQSFLFRIIFVISGPIIGWIADVAGFQQAFIVSAVVFALPIGISFLFLRQHHFQPAPKTVPIK